MPPKPSIRGTSSRKLASPEPKRKSSAPSAGLEQSLPEDWTCDRCGKTSAETTVFWPISRMDLDERVTLNEYGVDEGQFFDGKDVALCGQCNGSHWKPPNDQAQRPGLTAGVERNETKGKTNE